jgi:hypothetical protein
MVLSHELTHNVQAKTAALWFVSDTPGLSRHPTPTAYGLSRAIVRRRNSQCISDVTGGMSCK